MKILIDDETLERKGATLDAEETLLLYRLVSKLSRDDLSQIGFTQPEAEKIEAWSEDYTR